MGRAPELDNRAGVLFDAGLVGEAEPDAKLPVLAVGAVTLGLLPANADSDGFLDHGKMLALGIFQPDWQPVWPAATTDTKQHCEDLTSSQFGRHG